MKKLLVVIDTQNDFINGALGSEAAEAIVPNVINKIQEWKDDIAYTLDTHYSNYLDTYEGKLLPIKHCIAETEGWKVHSGILTSILDINSHGIVRRFIKETFGSTELANWIRNMKYGYIEIIGLCTDICVISNALCIKAFNPETPINVIANCCAGTTPELHNKALDVMKSCLINIE